MQEQLRTRVIDALTSHPALDAGAVAVTVRGGVVELDGCVSTEEERSRALSCVEAVEGVKAIHLRLEIGPSPDALRARIASIPEIDASNLRVTTTGQSVELTGTVPAFWQAVRAAEVVATAPGVTRVHDKITVVRTGAPRDQSIAESVATKLEYAPHVDPHTVRVEVEDGVVFLFGEVASGFARMEARDAAAYTSGVTEVHEHIRLANGVPAQTVASSDR